MPLDPQIRVLESVCIIEVSPQLVNTSCHRKWWSLFKGFSFAGDIAFPWVIPIEWGFCSSLTSQSQHNSEAMKIERLSTRRGEYRWVFREVLSRFKEFLAVDLFPRSLFRSAVSSIARSGKKLPAAIKSCESYCPLELSKSDLESAFQKLSEQAMALCYLFPVVISPTEPPPPPKKLFFLFR